MSRQWSRSDLAQQLRSEIIGYFGAATEFDERVAKKFKLSRTDMRCVDLLGRLGPMTRRPAGRGERAEHGCGDLPAWTGWKRQAW